MNLPEDIVPENIPRADAADILHLEEARNFCPFLPLTRSQDTASLLTPLTVATRVHPPKIFSKSNPDKPESCDDRSELNLDGTSNTNWEHSPSLLLNRTEHVNRKVIPKSKITPDLFSKKTRNVYPLSGNRGIVQFKLKSGDYRSELSKHEHQKLHLAVPKSNPWQWGQAYQPDKPISQGVSLVLNFRDTELKSTMVNLSSFFGKIKEENTQKTSGDKISNVTACNPDELASYADVLKLNNDVMELHSEGINIPQSSDDNKDPNDETPSAMPREIDSECCRDKSSSYAGRLKLNIASESVPECENIHLSDDTDENRETHSTMSREIDSKCCPDKPSSYADRLKLHICTTEMTTECENVLQISGNNLYKNCETNSAMCREIDSACCLDKPSYAEQLTLDISITEMSIECENIPKTPCDNVDGNCETHCAMSREIDSACPDKPGSFAEQLNLNASASDLPPGLCIACDPDEEIRQGVSPNLRGAELTSVVHLSPVLGKTKDKKKKKKTKKMKTQKTGANEITNVTTYNPDELTTYAVLELNSDVMELQSECENIIQSSNDNRDRNCENHSALHPERDSECCPDKPSSYAGRLKLNISITEIPTECENAPDSSSDNRDRNCETHSAMSEKLDSKCHPDKPSSYADRLKLNIIVNEIAPECEHILQSTDGNAYQNCQTHNTLSREIDSVCCPDKPISYADRLKLNIKASEFAPECENIHIVSSEINDMDHKCTSGKIHEQEVHGAAYNSDKTDSCDSQLNGTPNTHECIASSSNTDGNIVLCSETQPSEQPCLTEQDKLQRCLNVSDKHDCPAAEIDEVDPEELSAVSSDYYDFDDILQLINQAMAPESPQPWRELPMPTEQTHIQNRMTAILEQPPFINWSPIVNINFRKDAKEESNDKNSLQDGHFLLASDDDGYFSSPSHMTWPSDSDSEVLASEPSHYSADNYFRGLSEFSIPESQRPESWMQSYLRTVRAVDTSLGTQEEFTESNPWWALSQNSMESFQNQSEHSESTVELKRQITNLSARIESAEAQLDTWKEVSAKLTAQLEQMKSQYEQEVRELTEMLETEKATSKRLQMDLCELAKKKEELLDVKTAEPEVSVNQLSRPVTRYSQNESPKLNNPGSNNTPKISAPSAASYPQSVLPGVSRFQLMTPAAAVYKYPSMGNSLALGPQLRPPTEHIPAAAVLFSHLHTVYSSVSSVYRFSGVRNPYVRGPQHKRHI